MDKIAFVPSTGQFFLWSESTADLPGMRADSAAALEQAGWPASAQIIEEDRPDQAAQIEQMPGFLIELLDALPILAATPVGTPAGKSLAVWGDVARFALELVLAGRVAPRLCARRIHEEDERIAGWEARWSVTLSTQAERRRLLALARALVPVQVAVPLPGRRPLCSSDQLRFAFHDSAQGLLRRFLDVCADTLLREAIRRGAYVRLGGWPADAWEQRFLRALIEDRAGFSCAGTDKDPAHLAQELQAWTEEQGAAAPPSWQASESLRHVIQRVLGQARLLGERLLMGEPAPRTLVPAVGHSRLSQSIAVTRALIQLGAGQAAPGQAKAAPQRKSG